MIVADKMVGEVRVALDANWSRNDWTIICCVGEAIVLHQRYGSSSAAAITAWVNCSDLVERARARHRLLSGDEGN